MVYEALFFSIKKWFVVLSLQMIFHSTKPSWSDRHYAVRDGRISNRIAHHELNVPLSQRKDRTHATFSKKMKKFEQTWSVQDKTYWRIATDENTTTVLLPTIVKGSACCSRWLQAISAVSQRSVLTRLYENNNNFINCVATTLQWE